MACTQVSGQASGSESGPDFYVGRRRRGNSTGSYRTSKVQRYSFPWVVDTVVKSSKDSGAELKTNLCR